MESDKLKNINLPEEIEKSFLDYAMSVIVSRALPDVRDGFKPVHRRIIYSMFELGLMPDKQYRKCARIVGDVLGKYHPHGDTSVYDALVRLSQDFSIRYPLVNGHGNFGSIDGDGAAAMRYTEAKMSKITAEMIRDINKNTIDFSENFDGSESEPTVLPSKVPNLLINGATGIAVGMATKIPPHNLGETINAVISYIDNHDVEVEELMNHIKGPDFPTGASILGNSGIKEAYKTGKGTITIRSNAQIEEINNNKTRIVITEIPYQINKSTLITKIAELVRDKEIEGVTDLRDESNREGIKIVIEIKKDCNANVILNNLYKHTQLQVSYSINMLALVDGEPKILTLKEIIEKYVEHQKEVILRRTKYDLEKASNRKHILEGYEIALNNIDEVVKIIKSATSDDDAINQLEKRFELTDIQSKAILEMKLRRLTGLERKKIIDELNELIKLIEDLTDILSKPQRVLNIIKDELIENKNKYGDERRTTIDMTAIDYIEDESLIPVEEIVVTITNKNYIKRVNIENYKTQNRGGVGIKGMNTNEEDFAEKIITMTTHDYIFFFTNKGKVYRMKGYEIPEFTRQSKGIPIVNLLPVEKDENISSLLKITKDDPKNYIVFCTQKGIVKKTIIEEFENIRANGKIAIKLKENDNLISVRKTSGASEVLLASSSGRMARFNENEIRTMGRNSYGVKGINLDNDNVVGCEVSDSNDKILVVTEKGYGKTTDKSEYRITKRGSKGVKALNITEKNGLLVAFKVLKDDEDIIIITDNGIIIRMPSNQIPNIGRVSQGVKLINLKNKQKVSTIALVKKDDQ